MKADLKGDIGAQPLLSFVCFLAPMSDQHSLPQAPSTMHTQLNYSRVMDRDQGLSGTCEPNQMVPLFYCLLQVCCPSTECRLILVCGYNCPDSEKPLFIFSCLVCQPMSHFCIQRTELCSVLGINPGLRMQPPWPRGVATKRTLIPQNGGSLVT